MHLYHPAKDLGQGDKINHHQPTYQKPASATSASPEQIASTEGPRAEASSHNQGAKAA